MKHELPPMGHQVTICPDGLTAVAALKRNTYDCILVDLDMPGLDGIGVIGKAKELSPETDAVVLTGKSSVESAIAALRYGAFDYLTKPCKLVELESLLKRVAEKRRLEQKCRALERRIETLEGSTQLVGDSEPMQRVRQMISKVAPTESTVLIRGETGTGKELVARSVHEQSGRADKPFVAINCGALPESLIESELFGHRRGSFTGAAEHRTGLFEVADGGTLFLDEIGELPKGMQAKLLRVLESGEIRRVGENESLRIDVRVVCATHRDLEEMVREEEFREDLLYRINTFEIALPPLREREQDILPLATHLLQRFRSVAAPAEEIFAAEVIEALRSHSWPGNVRELANVIEHATILCGDGPIQSDHLPHRFSQRETHQPKLMTRDEPVTLREMEMQAIYDALQRQQGNKQNAAKELGISVKTLYNKLNQAASLRESA